MSFESITLNLDASPANTRLETLEGVDYKVVPAVMIVEGVLNGSNGPLLYGSNEISKTPEIWNYKPVVVNHPVENGASVSACTPAVLETRKVGLLMNTEARTKPSRLGTEVWLQMNKLKKVDNRIYKAVEKGEAVEVSTGLFTDQIATNGTFGNDKYNAIATNFRPDHLAILPDTKGACSIADGAGLTANGISDNGLSFSKIRELIDNKLEVNQPKRKPGEAYIPRPWVRQVYNNLFIISLEGKLTAQSYTINKEQTDVEFVGLPQPVVREYRTPSGQFVANSATNPKEEPMDPNTPAEKKTDETEGTLNEDSKTTEKVEKPEAMAPTENVAAPKLELPNSDATVTTTSFVANQNTPDVPTQPLTLDQYIANAPAAMQDVLNEGVVAHARDKEALIKSITDNARNVFTPEQLAAKPIAELRQLSALAAPEAELANNAAFANYAGATAGSATSSEAVEEPLGLPTMNFDNAEEKK